MGIALYNEAGAIQLVTYKHTQASDPLQAEAAALLNALQFAEVHCQIDEETNYAVYSDCKTLGEIVTEYRLDDIPSWRAAETVTKCANTFQGMQGWVTIHHVNREVLRTRHDLVNKARTTRDSYCGYPNEYEVRRMNLKLHLDSTIFTNQDSQNA